MGVAMRNDHRLAIAIGVSLLSACGGGGGGGGGDLPPIIPFQSFSAVQPGQPVEATGVSQTAAVTTDAMGTVTGVSVNPADLSSSAQLTYGSGSVLTGLSIKTPQSSPSWSGAEISCSPICAFVNATSVGVGVNALDPGVAWNYQTYGFWAADGAPEIGGVISIGAPTPVGGIPITGMATYNGSSSGIYIDAGGATWIHAADMLAVADFNGAARSVAFSTMNTVATNGVGPTSMPGLDLSGTLSIVPGANEIRGTVTTASTFLFGPATGRFYGPTAQEIGGVYALTDGTFSPHTMIGGFGGKQ